MKHFLMTCNISHYVDFDFAALFYGDRVTLTVNFMSVLYFFCMVGDDVLKFEYSRI